MSTQTAPALIAVEIEAAESAPTTVPFYLPCDFGAASLRLEEGRFTAADFELFAAVNPDLRLELNKEGEMIILMPMFPSGGNREFKLNTQFGVWVEATQTGVGFSSATTFTLPNGAKRSPDVAWISQPRWDALTEAQKNSFTRICPEFVVELRSQTDRLKTLQAKLDEYMENGAQLGWLIDPLEKKVHVYRPGAPAEILDNPTEVSGEPLLPGFVLKLADIFA